LAVAPLLTAQLVGFGDYSLGAIRDGNFEGGGGASEGKPGDASRRNDDQAQ
jgi:hypothetical protein